MKLSLLSLLLIGGSLTGCRSDFCRSADDALVERLHIRGPVIGASVVEYSDEVWYLVVSVDYQVGVWATDLDRSGEGRGVIVPANDTARDVSSVGLDTVLPPSHLVALAASDHNRAEDASSCEAQRK